MKTKKETKAYPDYVVLSEDDGTLLVIDGQEGDEAYNGEEGALYLFEGTGKIKVADKRTVTVEVVGVKNGVRKA